MDERLAQVLAESWTPSQPAPDLSEQVAVQRHGQSVYAAPGRLSIDQRRVEGQRAMDLLERVSLAAGRAAGHEAGRRAGRLEAWRRIGPHALAGLIAEDLAAIRRALDR